MLRFAANLSTMFDEKDELSRLDHIARLGFRYVEWLFPYGCNKHEIASRLNALNLELVLINTALGSAQNGDRGIGAIPGREDEFKEAMTQALEYVAVLDVPMIHVMAGVCPRVEEQEEYLETFARNLTWATQELGDLPTQLLVEPLNLVDTPNYLISTSRQALQLIDIVNANIGLQFDFYHLQIMEGNLGHSLKSHIDRVAHVQFSSVPGRHEPQYGEVNCDYLFTLLESLSYKGYIGCEYRPKTTVEEGLSWAIPYGLGLNATYTASA